MMATTGEIAIMTRGKTIASANRRTAAGREIVTSGDESDTTGSKVIAEIAQRESMPIRSTSAMHAASKNGAANAMTRMRRSSSVGHSVSLIAVTLGCAANRLRTIAAAT